MLAINKWPLKLNNMLFELAPPQKIKYVGINLKKYVQDVYKEIYITLIRTFNIVKMLNLPNLIYRIT